MRGPDSEAAGSSVCDARLEGASEPEDRVGRVSSSISARFHPSAALSRDGSRRDRWAEHTRGCRLWKLKREPIELQERRGWSLLLSAGASREPSLTTDSTLAFPSGTSSHFRSSLPRELPFHRRGRLRSLSADTCDIPLNGHPRPMPTHRSLSGSAVISLSCERAYGAARGARGADPPS